MKAGLPEGAVRQLHGRMFGATWRWAGEFRRSNKSLGVDWHRIPVALRDVLADAAYWFEHGTYPPTEAAVWFHHRLVQVHCFPNGNGRPHPAAPVRRSGELGLQGRSLGIRPSTGYLEVAVAAHAAHATR